MKLSLGFMLLAASCIFAQEADERMVLVPWAKAPKEAPLFHSVKAEVKAMLGMENVRTETIISFQIHQGKSERLVIGLTGKGEVKSVSGEAVAGWAVRVNETGERFLELTPHADAPAESKQLDAVLASESPLVDGLGSVLLPAPAAQSAGFVLAVTLTGEQGVTPELAQVSGLFAVDDATSESKRFVGDGRAVLDVIRRDSASLELTDARVSGRLDESGESTLFRLTGTLRAKQEGAKMSLLHGAALLNEVDGIGWRVQLSDDDATYEIVAEEAGDWPVLLDFVVPVEESEGYRELAFRLHGGVVVPITIEGIDAKADFAKDRAVVPRRDASGWRGFLPAGGSASMAWKPGGDVGDGALFFSSTAISDVQVGSGLLRQETQLALRVLQGKLESLTFKLDGDGEVLAVDGSPVLGWSVRTDGDDRLLDVRLARPIIDRESLRISSQAALGAFPVRAEVMRISPIGSLRHSGWLRVRNEGAVRVEVAETEGLIQLSPEQFPAIREGGSAMGSVFRFPAAEHRYVVLARQVLPEVSVMETTVYELAETDRRISSTLELDVREAPIRDWEMTIPADYAVASVQGNKVLDFSLLGEASNGGRVLKIVFHEPLIDRHLLTLVLEKNEAANAGSWNLPSLGFPQAKSRRGNIGAVATPGYRLVPGSNTGLAEVPVTFFPAKVKGLQQAWRLREETWNLSLGIEALGQSIEADVFHLYSLKSGAIYGSVLLNYFVVGAPANEWQIEVPEDLGNVDVTGLNVGRDWRREGNRVIVPLSSPVLGAGTVLLTFEKAMSPRGGSLTPGQVKPLGVQSERGFVQVVSPMQVKHEVTTDGALLPIDASELPAEFRLLSSAPTIGAWQYTAREFSINLDIKSYQDGETLRQVVDFMKLSSQVSRDGQWVTDALVVVKSRGESVLRMKLPAGAELWDARANGEAVNARSDAGTTLIPLPVSGDPRQAVEVSLRYGAKAKHARDVALSAPTFEVPVVLGEWKVTGDEARRLIPKAGTADLTSPALDETGWQWFGRYPGKVMMLVLLAALATGLSVGHPGTIRAIIAAAFGFAFLAFLVTLLPHAASSLRPGAGDLAYSMRAVAAGSEVSVRLGNVPPWMARAGFAVWFFTGLGLLAAIRGMMTGNRLWFAAGMGCVLFGLLSLRGGVLLFFLVLGLIALLWWLPLCIRLVRALLKPRHVVAASMLVFCWGGMDRVEAADAEERIAFAKTTQEWRIEDGRLFGNMSFSLTAEQGKRIVMLRTPAVLTGLTAESLRVEKQADGKETAWHLVVENSGTHNGTASFEMPLPHPAKGWTDPTGPSAMRQVTVRWPESGWQLDSPAIARRKPLGDPAKESSAVFTLLPGAETKWIAKLKQRDASLEQTQFFTEVRNRFLSSPGVVDGRHEVKIRPARGVVNELRLRVPDGFTVSDVKDGPVGAWRFDPQRKELLVPISPKQDEAFSFVVETQRGTTGLPVELNVEPLRLTGSAGEVGLVGLVFAEEVQAEDVKPEGMTRVDAEDFGDAKLGPFQHVFRYGAEEAKLALQMVAVAPELRASFAQLVSLGEDRLAVSLDLTAEITRSGVFRLDLSLPDGLEVDSVTGEGLSHWTEGGKAGERTLTLHLSGRTLGQKSFAVSLSGKPVGEMKSWRVPGSRLSGASRETGVVTVVPERGLQVRTVNRRLVSQIDPRDLSEAPQDTRRAAVQPGALAFRTLQSGWLLDLAIDKLDPWITAQVQHDVTVREGQRLNVANLTYRIENAAVKALRVRLPGLDEAAAATLRATGQAVADLVPVAGEEGLWEIRFERGVAGETKVELAWQSVTEGEAAGLVEAIRLEEVRQVSYLVAVRAGGRLEISPETLPRGWQRVDWSAASKQNSGDSSTPAIAFRVAEPEGPLRLTIKRHELADLRRIRISEGELTTLLSSRGTSLTAVRFRLELNSKSTLRLRLPDDSRMFHAMVNGEAASLVREGEDWLCLVSPSPDPSRPAELRFVYASPIAKGSALLGPMPDAPMENLRWNVLLPDGWRMKRHRGDFDLIGRSSLNSYGFDDYRSVSTATKESESKAAVAMLDQASRWLEEGDQERASKAFSNVANNGFLDAASGEDARVQLRALKTQQAVLGLNTRRQRMVMENRISQTQADDNEQLDRAMQANPVFDGAYNFDPRQFNRFLEGNTSDENSALKEIANRIVNQQLATEPLPAMLDVTLPEAGRVVKFSRSVQLSTDKPMRLELTMVRERDQSSWLALPLCLLAAVMTVLKRGKPVAAIVRDR